jgi:hypothetical protein
MKFTEAECKEAAQSFAATLARVADAIAERMVAAEKDGIDPNGLRETARDILVGLGIDQVRAANVVRLAIHRVNLSHGVTTYNRKEIATICHRIGYGAPA